MKNKKLLCIIAILCVITCALSVVFTACDKKDDGGSTNNSPKFDFNAIPEYDWEGEELTKEQWEKAFDQLNFDNVTIYFGQYDDTTKEYSSMGSFFFELDSNKMGLREDTKIKCGTTYEEKFLITLNRASAFYLELDEAKTIDRNHAAFTWVKLETAMSLDELEYLSDIVEEYSFPWLEERYSDFEYRDGAYFAENFIKDSDSNAINLKITFKNGKLFMLEVKDRGIVAYRDYGKTTVSLPEDYISSEDVPDVYGCEHVDYNKNDICDVCWKPLCDEHVDEDNNRQCDWCNEELPCKEHEDKDNDGYCDWCDECAKHVDVDDNGHCDRCGVDIA